jgi:hypothetical protein
MIPFFYLNLNIFREWNLIHPNYTKTIQKSNENQKLFSIGKFQSIGKIIFTHMASFILGATL